MKKLLVIGIIALFIGLAFIPSFNAVSISTTSDDTTPPVTTISLNGTMSEWGIFTSDVEVTLNATDDMSGVNVTYYRLDTGELKTYNEPFIITGHANHVLVYWSYDNAGNKENTKGVYITIDLIPPEINLHYDRLENGSIKFDPYLYESGSSLDKVEYYINNTHMYTSLSNEYYCWIWTPNSTGRYFASGIVYDRAGNSARDEFYINIPRSKAMSISNDVEEDCFECQSNGKTHLAVKLINRLEKNEVISKVIKSNNLWDDDRPICILLNNIIQRLLDYADSLFYLMDTLPEDSILGEIISMIAYMIGWIGVGYVAAIAIKLNCWEITF